MIEQKITVKQKEKIKKLSHLCAKSGVVMILLFTGLFFTQEGIAQGSQVFNSNGTFNLPAGVTSITVEAWGGGAGGNYNSYGGGGGGAYSKITIANPGSSYIVTVGTGGAAGANGNNTTFGSVLTANGAIGAAGGVASVGTGIISYKGGNGAGGTANSGGGAGASSAGQGANGSGGTGGVGVAPGGSGGNGSTTTNGQPGSVYGGGGGTHGSSGGSGAGANGEVIVSWTCPAATITYTAAGFCKSVTSALATISGSQGGTISVLPASGLTINTATGEINPSTSTTGTYIVHYQIASGGNGCTAVDATTSVTINPLPVTASTSTNITCFGANDGAITVSGSGGSGPYTFSVDGITFLGPAGASRLFTGLVPNSPYIIKVKDNNACISK